MDDRRVPPGDNPVQPTGSGEGPDWSASPVEPPFALPEEDMIGEPAGVPHQEYQRAPVYPAATTTRTAVGREAVQDDYADFDDEYDEYGDFNDDQGMYRGETYQPRSAGTRRRPTGQYQQSAPSGRGYGCLDLITAIFVLLTITSCAFTVLLLSNPQSALNPLRPPTLPVLMIIATDPPSLTPSLTFTPAPATPTPNATSTPTETATWTPTWTPTITDTPVVGNLSLPTEAGATATPTIEVIQPTSQYTLSPFPFTVDPIRYTSNTGTDGCNWQSVAGSVTDLQGKPIKGLAIRVTGSNGNIDEVHYTGTEPRYGDSGFEVFLGAIPRVDQYTVQLLGRTGSPISDTVTIESHTGCKENVVIVHFVQNHPY
jgi:hypothetical protein